MRRSSGVAAIDVGTTKIGTLVGGYDERGRLRVTGAGITASRGINRGVVDDAGRATAAIAASIKVAEQASNSRIVAATVGIAGAHITCLNTRGTVLLPNSQRPISRDDVARALEGARNVDITSNRHVIGAVPRFFVIDGEESSGDPVGRYGQRLDVEALVITGALTAIQNLTSCVEAAGVQVEGLVLEPLAAADAVLDEEERSHGVVLVDIGGGTTDLAVFVEGSIIHTAVLPVGGNQITSDVVYGLRVPFSEAERIKELFGHAMPEAVAPDETVEVEAFGRERIRMANRRRMCEIVQARVAEILEFVRDEVHRAGYEGMISAGAVLTGGTANLLGIADLAEQVLQMPARDSSPVGVYNLDETLDNPAFSTSVGLLGWAVREHDAVLRALPRRRREARSGGVLRRMSGLARLMLPE